MHPRNAEYQKDEHLWLSYVSYARDAFLYAGRFDGYLQTLNGHNKLALWAGRISECRNSGQNIKTWCKKNGICEQTYYRWQKRLFELAKAQREVPFVEVTPVQPVRSGNVAVTVRIAGAEADIHSGADAVTVETVLRILKSC